MALDVRRLRVLREVAARGSFSAAADSLNFTQPAISRQIATLEAETGQRLVERNARVIRINDVDRLAELVDFHDRHGEVATDWLPPVGALGDMDHPETRIREHM